MVTSDWGPWEGAEPGNDRWCPQTSDGSKGAGDQSKGADHPSRRPQTGGRSESPYPGIDRRVMTNGDIRLGSVGGRWPRQWQMVPSDWWWVEECGWSVKGCGPPILGALDRGLVRGRQPRPWQMAPSDRVPVRGRRPRQRQTAPSDKGTHHSTRGPKCWWSVA